MAKLQSAKEKQLLSESEIKEIWGTKKLEDGSLMIVSYKGTDKNIVVPSMIGKKKVTAISSETFDPTASRITELQKNARMKIVSVEFPGSICEIPKEMLGSNAFHIKYPALKKIVLNEGTKKVCRGAFQHCTKIKEIELPSSIETLESMVFWGCTGLEKVTIPSGVKVLGSNIFCGCRKLKEVHLPDELEKIPDGMFDGCKALSDFQFPNGVIQIGAKAFSECSFEKVVVPPTVRRIEKGAFSECKKLKEIAIPKGTEFGEAVFENCNLLADDKKQIVVDGIFFGMLGSGYDLTAKETLKPLVLRDDVITIALDREKLPEIVYKEHSEKGTTLDVSTLEVGDSVLFGRFPEKDDCVMKPLKWRVLEMKAGKALLITENEIMSHRDNLDQKGVWKDCCIRNLLNKGFYESAFTEIERSQIVCSTIENPENREHHTKGGPSTKDWVFLLSVDEVEQYMPTEESRTSSPTEYAHNQCSEKRDCGYWQLRTPGKAGWGSAAVADDTGFCDMTGNHVGYSYLRPVIWVENK